MLKIILSILFFVALAVCVPQQIGVPSLCLNEINKGILDRQNYYRVQHHVPKLLLSASLSELVQKRTWNVTNDAKGFVASTNTTILGSYGEVIFQGWSNLHNTTNNTVCNEWAVKIVDQIYSRLFYYNYTGTNSYANYVKPVTQMLWKSSSLIGIGVNARAYDYNSIMYFAMVWYSLAGNIDGQYQNNVLPK